MIDPGEEPKVAAVRELQEETGFLVEEIEELGAFYPSFGSTNEKIYLFTAKCKKHGADHKDPAEVLWVEQMAIDEFKKEIASGEFAHGAGLAAWARYERLIDKI